jgi:hypothetical protein
LINEKDKLINNLVQELKEKEEKIKSLNKDILNIKKEKDYQQDSFQNIIKDLQFMQGGLNTNLNPIEKSENV